MNIILLGHINSGKTTVANYIAQKYNYNHYALGDGVKVFIVDLFKILHKLDHNIDEIELKDLYDRSKKEKYRQCMQLISTDLVRKYFGEDIWINFLKNKVKEPYVIDDIRFKEEYEFFKDNSISIKIKRPDELNMNHISEHDVDDIKTDYTIINDSDLESLYYKIDCILNSN
jgi:adenylate kinase family enzyme